MPRTKEEALAAHRRWYANLSAEKKAAYKRREADRIAAGRHSEDLEVRARYRAVSKRYSETHKEEIKARNKRYRETHKEKVRAYDKAYKEAHREQIRAYQREYRRKKREIKSEE